MSRHESLVRLRHMLDHSREAVAMVAGKTREDLDADRKLNLALVRLLEIVGQAANRTPADETRSICANSLGANRRITESTDSWVRFGRFRHPLADRHARPAAVDSGTRTGCSA